MATAFGYLSGLLSGSPTTVAPGSCVTMDPITFKPVPIATSSLNENNVPWHVGLKWAPAINSMFYASMSEGYKSGGYSTQPIVVSSEDVPAVQEKVRAYEAWFKVRLFNDLVQADGAAFYYDYKNKQTQGSVLVPVFGALPVLVNVPASSIKGLELDTTWHPI